MARKASLNSLLAKLEEDLDGPKVAPRGDVYRYEEVSEDISGLANTTVSIRDLPSSPTPFRQHKQEPFFLATPAFSLPPSDPPPAGYSSSASYQPRPTITLAEQSAPASSLPAGPPSHYQEDDPYEDPMWQDVEALQLVLEAEEKYKQDAGVVDKMPRKSHLAPGFHEPVVTPAVLQQRERDELESVNERGQLLLSTKKIEEKYRRMFPFDMFNAVQSKALDDVYNSSQNIVLAAPTSAGKTTIFELALLRMIKEWEFYPEKRLAIYIAPTKALCFERSTDWSNRLSKVSPELTCIQVTGDNDKVDLIGVLKNATLVVTTPEKWDAITRRGIEGQRILNRVSLVMIDEVHILCESRGPTLEVVVSRMKSLGRQIRFVAVSASVPNIEDVARWLAAPPEEEEEIGFLAEGGDENKPAENTFKTSVPREAPMAKVLKFGDDYRPVRLKKIVRGYEAANQWGLNPILDKALMPELLKLQELDEHRGKPVLVFCPTRKTCQTTAEYMYEQYEQQRAKRGTLPWDPPNRSQDDGERLSDDSLDKWSRHGIAVHHAGLDTSDRHLIEEWFRKGRLRMLVSTSTLAVGVNLPAHTVVIKGTMSWGGPIIGLREYSDIEIQQMTGRAGRPQYDQSGVVILMCEKSLESKYRDMINSKTILESRLHDHLTEHLNSEINRKTITDFKSAQEWLKGYSETKLGSASELILRSFFFVRIKQNPEHYAIPGATTNKPSSEAWEEWIRWYVEEALVKLEANELVTHDPGQTEEESKLRKGLETSSYGSIMSKYCILLGRSQMCSIMGVQDDSTVRDMLEVLCGATEFAELRVRPGETAALNAVRKSDKLRYKLDDQVKTYADKVFIHLQLCWAGSSLEEEQQSKDEKKTENASSRQTLMGIYHSAPRIADAILRVCTERAYGLSARNALELAHVVHGRAWEDTAIVFRQLLKIGPKSIMMLASRRVTTFRALRELPAAKINEYLNRTGDFGDGVHREIDKLPQYSLTLTENEFVSGEPDDYPMVKVDVVIKCLSTDEAKESVAKGRTARKRKWEQYYRQTLTVLVIRTDGKLICNRTIQAHKFDTNASSFTLTADFTDPDQRLMAYIGVNEVSGLMTAVEFPPDIPSNLFPVAPKGQDGNDANASVAPDSARMANGNFPCAHACANKEECNHVCCKEGVKKSSVLGRGKKGNPRLAGELVNELDQRVRDKTKLSKKKEQSALFASLLDDEAEPHPVPAPEPEPEEERIDLTVRASKLKSAHPNMGKGKQKTTNGAASKPTPVKTQSSMSGIEELASDDPVFDKANRKRKSSGSGSERGRCETDIKQDGGITMDDRGDKPQDKEQARPNKRVKAANAVDAVVDTMDEADMEVDDDGLIPLDQLLTGGKSKKAAKKRAEDDQNEGRDDRTTHKVPAASPARPRVSPTSNDILKPPPEEQRRQPASPDHMPMHLWSDVSMGDELDNVADTEMVDELENLLAQSPATPAISTLNPSLLEISFDMPSTRPTSDVPDAPATSKSPFRHPHSRPARHVQERPRALTPQNTIQSPPARPSTGVSTPSLALYLSDNLPRSPARLQLVDDAVESEPPPPHQQETAKQVTQRGKRVVRFGTVTYSDDTPSTTMDAVDQALPPGADSPGQDSYDCYARSQRNWPASSFDVGTSDGPADGSAEDGQDVISEWVNEDNLERFEDDHSMYQEAPLKEDFDDYPSSVDGDHYERNSGHAVCAAESTSPHLEQRERRAVAAYLEEELMVGGAYDESERGALQQSLRELPAGDYDIPRRFRHGRLESVPIADDEGEVYGPGDNWDEPVHVVGEYEPEEYEHHEEPHTLQPDYTERGQGAGMGFGWEDGGKRVVPENDHDGLYHQEARISFHKQATPNATACDLPDSQGADQDTHLFHPFTPGRSLMMSSSDDDFMTKFDQGHETVW